MTVYATYDPTALFAGDLQPVQRAINLAAGQNAAPVNAIPTPLLRGTLLGRTSVGAATSAPKTGGNTGNGTLTPDPTTPVLATGQNGAYTVLFTAPTAYSVTDPSGNAVGTGVVGTAFANQIKFNIAAGATAFVAGDSFVVTAEAQDDYIVSKATATDGSQIPSAILAYDADTSMGVIRAPAYFTGEFAGEKMTFDPSWTIATIQVAMRVNNIPMFVRSVGVLG